MVLPIIVLIAIPVFLGIVYVSPVEQPVELQDEVISEPDEIISEDSDGNILYFLLMGIWMIFLMRILLRIKRGTFRITQRY